MTRLSQNVVVGVSRRLAPAEHPASAARFRATHRVAPIEHNAVFHLLRLSLPVAALSASRPSRQRCGLGFRRANSEPYSIDIVDLHGLTTLRGTRGSNSQLKSSDAIIHVNRRITIVENIFHKVL